MELPLDGQLSFQVIVHVRPLRIKYGRWFCHRFFQFLRISKYQLQRSHWLNKNQLHRPSFHDKSVPMTTSLKIGATQTYPNLNKKSPLLVRSPRNKPFSSPIDMRQVRHKMVLDRSKYYFLSQYKIHRNGMCRNSGAGGDLIFVQDYI